MNLRTNDDKNIFNELGSYFAAISACVFALFYIFIALYECLWGDDDDASGKGNGLW